MDQDAVTLTQVGAGVSREVCTRCGAPVQARRPQQVRPPRASRDGRGLCRRCYQESLEGQARLDDVDDE